MSEYYLAHHGILGMKWGVRRYQNADGSYTALGRARYFNKYGGLTDKGKIHYGVSNKEAKEYNQYKRNKTESNSSIEKIQRKIEIGDDATKKALAIVGGVAVAGLAAYAGYKAYEYFGKGGVSEMKRAAASINYGMFGRKYLEGRNTNCAYCSIAYDLKRRGIDVKAGHNTDGGMTLNSISEIYGKTYEDFKQLELNSGNSNIIDVLSKEPNGSRGVFVMQTGYGIFGAGHAVAYEVMDGKAHIIDCQTNKMYNNNATAAGLVNMFSGSLDASASCKILRTDNIDTNSVLNNAKNNNIVVDKETKLHESLDLEEAPKNLYNDAVGALSGIGIASLSYNAIRGKVIQNAEKEKKNDSRRSKKQVDK